MDWPHVELGAEIGFWDCLKMVWKFKSRSWEVWQLRKLRGLNWKVDDFGEKSWRDLCRGRPKKGEILREIRILRQGFIAMDLIDIITINSKSTTLYLAQTVKGIDQQQIWGEQWQIRNRNFNKNDKADEGYGLHTKIKLEKLFLAKEDQVTSAVAVFYSFTEAF